MRSAIRVLFAVVFVGVPAIVVAVVGVGWWRSGEPPDLAYHLWPLAAVAQFIGGLALAIIGGIAIGTARWPQRVWPHVLQLWGAALIVEAILQMLFIVAAAMPTTETDGVYSGYPWQFLVAVAVLALVVTPTLVVWQTRVLFRRLP
jgi:hypothetical protein